MSPEIQKEDINKDSQLKITRRRLLTLLAGGVLMSSLIISDQPKPFVIGLYIKGKPFGDKKANEEAERLGMTAGSFFKFEDQVLSYQAGGEKKSDFQAFLGERLLPIYPPAVLSHRRLIYQLASEFNTPPFVPAALMSIESAGKVDAISGAKAQGLFQVMPFHFDFFQEKVQALFPGENILQIWRQAYDSATQKEKTQFFDPLLNGRTGMRFFVNECLPAAEQELRVAGYTKNHPVILARAFMAYNNGSAAVRLPFNLLPDETKLYGDHVIRLVETAQLAQVLRDSNYSDKQIIQNLSSLEVDARAFALQEFVWGKNLQYSYPEYEEALRLLGGTEVPIANLDSLTLLTKGDKRDLAANYQAYLRSPNFKLPASAGLRIWLALGGYRLFNQVPQNVNIKAWESIAT